MAYIVIVKNDTTSVITIEDLGIEISGSGQVTLSDISNLSEIISSNDLKSLVSNSTLIINNGINDLSVEDGLKYISINTDYEDEYNVSHRLLQHPGIKKPKKSNIPLTLQYDDSTGFIFVEALTHGTAARPSIAAAMGGHEADHVSTATDVYQTIRSFYYAGTSDWTPTRFRVLADVGKAGETGYARVYDVTNNLQIAEVSFTNTTKATVVTTSITNLPVNEALLELQTMATKKEDVRCYYAELS